LEKHLGGLVINRRVNSRNILDVAREVVGAGGIRAVITIAGDDILSATTDGKIIRDELRALHPKSRVLDVQTKDNDGNPLFIPVPALYDLALHLGFEKEIDAGFAALLNRIGLFFDADGEPIDPLKISTYFIIRLIPRIRPENINEDAAAQTMAREAVDSSL
jgi:hypothetical protein